MELLQGFVYKITSKHTPDIYIGSTIQRLDYRLSDHRSKNAHRSNIACSSKEIVKYEDAVIELIETVYYTNIKELRDKELEYIIANREICVNVKRYKDDKEQKKEWNEKNAEKIREQQKEYREKNREKLREDWKKYYEKNCEKLRERQSKVIDCECGVHYTSNHKARHSKSKKHQAYINNLAKK
jgi:hypothetical protein